ncbi:Blastoderm-specific protein 25D [Eumeta japonica]|uniref:Blastoderm-specific protein 25D n=1 Tax=Eumeta variegata TaxID=151549 RepID=A0A4C1T4R3_EUMVA|nr:Blastoderm-specific protein 25D [Eumeta japonica]
MDETHHSNTRKLQFEKSSDDEEVLRLVEKVSTLQIENCNLRDKNDELIAEIETLNHDLNKIKLKWKKVSLNQEVANQDGDDNEVSSSSAAIKRRGDSPSKTRLIEESPRLGKLRKCTNDANNTCSENSDTSGEWMALNSELHNSQGKTSAQLLAEMENLKKNRRFRRST